MATATCDLCEKKDKDVWVCDERHPHWCDDCLELPSEEFEKLSNEVYGENNENMMSDEEYSDMVSEYAEKFSKKNKER